MKTILHKQKRNVQRGIKFFVVRRHSEDQRNTTHVKKSFAYKISRCDNANPVTKVPEIFVTKVYDTKNYIERINLRIRGCFYMTYGRLLVKVQFKHRLDIEITWKSKHNFPKKSAILTE